MKRILAILSVIALLSTACSNDEANTGQRAESEWNNYIQKHLIGEWKPEYLVVKPLAGEILLKEDYAELGKSIMAIRLDKDFTGVLTRVDQQQNVKTIAFTWYHKFEELGLLLPNYPVFKAVILHKSQQELEVALPLEQVLPYLDLHLQEQLNSAIDSKEELLAILKFVK